MKKFIFVSAVVSLTQMYSCKYRLFNDDSTDQPGIQAVSNTESIQLFDVNDVSIMFPPSAFIPLNSKHISAQQFRDVYDAGEGKGPNSAIVVRFGNRDELFKNLRIVSLRYDPCSPGAHAAALIAEQIAAPNIDTVCEGQVRIVAQPLVGGIIADVAFHLIYGVPKTESARRDQLVSLAKIKQASKAAGASTDGVALTEHPGLVLGSPQVRAALNDFINLTINPATIVSVAVTALANNAPEPWVFYAVRNVNGRMIATGIPTVENKGFFQSLSFLGTPHVSGKPSNTATFDFASLPNLKRLPILARSTDSVFADPKFNQNDIVPLNTEIMSRIHAIENPRVNHFFTMDCVSCHTASTLMMRRHVATLAKPSESEVIKGANTSRCFIPKGTTGYVGTGGLPVRSSFGSPWNTRSFGVFDGRATIAFRTACESAEVAEDINIRMLSRKHAGPNISVKLTDADYSKVEHSIWRCMHFQNNKTFDECLTMAKALNGVK